MKKLVLASLNPGKLKELKVLLADVPVELIGLEAFPGLAPAVEYGRTFFENAFLKALHYANTTGALVLADDSGLDVSALGGKPGVESARFAGVGADDRKNNEKLLALLGACGSPPPWPARYRCVLVVKGLGQTYWTRSGICEGEIRPEPDGDGGFGYDPYFYLPDRNLSMARISPEEKNLISHRGRALEALRGDLAAWLELAG